jgi:hypothetical protein
MARADKAWGRLVDDTLYRGNIDVGAVTDRRAPLRWSASAKRLVHGERHARICVRGSRAITLLRGRHVHRR